MHKFHKELLGLIKNEAKRDLSYSKHSSAYDGHSGKSFSLTNPQLRQIVKSWLRQHDDLTFDDYIKLLNSLYENSDSSTEKYVAGLIIECTPTHRKNIDPRFLNKWLNNLTGWSQVDSLCQSRFSSSDLVSNWRCWRKLLVRLNSSKNSNKRRASLVLLTRPSREISDNRFADIAIINIDSLKHEKDILITKAISWLLREMIKNHRRLVKKYLAKNENTLPKIAVRETKRKLETGKK